MDQDKKNRDKNDTLSAIFSKFAGREIDVIETPYEYKGQKRIRTNIVGEQNNPLVQEMNQHAKDVGLKLGISAIFPTTPMQCMYPVVYAQVEKHADGKYRIGQKFTGANVINLKDFMP